jgi:hypothetical protein
MATSNNENDQVSLVIPPAIAAVLGRPALTRVEDRAAYDKLFTDLAVDWEPRSTTEWIFVRDLADQSWEVLRLRRAITDILDISLRPAL